MKVKKKRSIKSEINLTELIIDGMIDLIVGVLSALIVEWIL